MFITSIFEIKLVFILVLFDELSVSRTDVCGLLAKSYKQRCEPCISSLEFFNHLLAFSITSARLSPSKTTRIVIYLTFSFSH